MDQYLICSHLGLCEFSVTKHLGLFHPKSIRRHNGKKMNSPTYGSVVPLPEGIHHFYPPQKLLQSLPSFPCGSSIIAYHLPAEDFYSFFCYLSVIFSLLFPLSCPSAVLFFPTCYPFVTSPLLPSCGIEEGGMDVGFSLLPY
ncbi:hypothetical protein NPIL_32761 [Nephila pilipes]|uniref:Uncharacterized protein n=1 Tax=Nephila pilipes TaxID=299642 RepID=A0A8X6TF23_NEPPI|nr:hypothetical protein NPIL_32761 [Nephila pilipes]